MPEGLLNLTFHLPSQRDGSGNLKVIGTMADDMLFRQHALEHLLKVDAMQAAGDPPPELMSERSPQRTGDAPGSGLVKDTDSAGKPFFSFYNMGTAAWSRAAFRKVGPTPSVFDTWMKKVLSTPVDCLVLAGHHSFGRLWGLEATVDRTHYPYSMFVPDADSKTLAVHGFLRGGGDSVLRGGPYDVSASLKSCRLLLIWGCNGAAADTRNWTPWRDLILKCNGKAPVILGHYMTHLWPRDNAPERFSKHFWDGMKVLAGGRSLTELCDQNPKDVIQSWADTMKATFKDSKHCNQHLFFQKKFTKVCKGYGPRGAGGVTPDGEILHVVDDVGKVQKVGEI